MNHTVFQIDPADSRFTDTFARFFTNCGEYELFSDCDTPYFAVFSDIDRTHCTGLLTFLISENESFTEAEVAAFVLPDYRRQGIFTALCGTAYHKIKAQYPDCMRKMPPWLLRLYVLQMGTFCRILLPVQTYTPR